MKYAVLFGASLIFVVLRSLSIQRNKQWELERNQKMKRHIEREYEATEFEEWT